MTFSAAVSLTLIGTATSIITIDGVTLLTDPVFDPVGSQYLVPQGLVLKSIKGPALSLENLKPVDLVLLSHEDHADNLDAAGRRLLDARIVLTTQDGAKNLAPRPGVTGLANWESITRTIAGKTFTFTAIPAKHIPGDECIGFVIASDTFGKTGELQNAIYFTGDTVIFDELYKIKDMWHISLMLVNLGNVYAPSNNGPLQITMDSASAAQLIDILNPDVVVPQHFDNWEHFTESSIEVKAKWTDMGVQCARYGEPGKEMQIFS